MYKAIIFDLDGTAIHSRLDAMPSQKVIEAVLRSKAKIVLAAATGRSYDLSKNVLHALKLDAPCIVSGGSEIVDPKNGQPQWQYPLTKLQLKQIANIYQAGQGKLFFKDAVVTKDIDLQTITAVGVVYIEGIGDKTALNLQRSLSEIPDVTVHIMPSWTNQKFDIHITHALATKKYGIKKWLEIMNLKKSEVVGIGDSNNDLPLFESVQFKIAMGNANDELKKAADLVTDSVDQDGLAKALETVLSF